MDLHRPVKKLEILRRKGDCTCAKAGTSNGHAAYSS
jgi:hypothetical protein